MDERSKLQEAIAHLEAQRETLGDEVVDSALAPLREELHRLEARLNSPHSSASRSPSCSPTSSIWVVVSTKQIGLLLKLQNENLVKATFTTGTI